MKATIQKVKLMRIDQVWKKHKPQGLGFSDTDAIVVNLKPKEGKGFSQTFYCRLKGDGTLGRSMTHASEKRQERLQNFIKEYISKDKKYNVRENINRWEGKDAEIEEIDGTYVIKI